MSVYIYIVTIHHNVSVFYNCIWCKSNKCSVPLPGQKFAVSFILLITSETRKIWFYGCPWLNYISSFASPIMASFLLLAPLKRNSERQRFHNWDMCFTIRRKATAWFPRPHPAMTGNFATIPDVNRISSAKNSSVQIHIIVYHHLLSYIITYHHRLLFIIIIWYNCVCSIVFI